MLEKTIALFLVIGLLPFYSEAAIRGNTEINYQFAERQEGGSLKIEGIFYDQNKPVVMIGGNLYYPGDSLSTGTVIKISPEKITIKFKNVQKEYGVGDSVSSEFEAQTGYRSLQPPSIPVTDGFDKINALLEDFISRYNENKTLLEQASSRRDNKEISDITSKTDKLISDYRQQLLELSVPAECDRCQSLAIKFFDIAEDSWKALTAGDRRLAEILAERMLRITQELSVRSGWLSGK